MTEHSPGPWRVVQYQLSEGIGIWDAYGDLVAEPSPSDLLDADADQEALVRANANLIAAAPDLLAACVDLVAYLDLGEARPCGACTPEEMCGYHAIVTDARTAIAKALEGVAS